MLTLAIRHTAQVTFGTVVKGYRPSDHLTRGTCKLHATPITLKKWSRYLSSFRFTRRDPYTQV